MQKNFIIIFIIFLFSSCVHNEKEIILNNQKKNYEIKIKNLKTFIKTPRSYYLDSNFKAKRMFFDDFIGIFPNHSYDLFRFSDALVCDLRRKKMKKDFDEIKKNIFQKALLSFEETNNTGKKYEFELNNVFYNDKKIFGYFLIKKIFRDHNNRICKNFKYMIFDDKEVIKSGIACRIETNEIFWNIEYEKNPNKTIFESD
jgi:hypothetical protein